MTEEFKFIYEKEIWYVSAIINTINLSCSDKACEIAELLTQRFSNLTDDDLKKIAWNPESLKKVREMGKNISLSCNWATFIEYFPYHDENTDLKFNSLGFFEFEVEYFKEFPKKKESIDPSLIQQIPTVALEILKEYSNTAVNKYLFIDSESPIYVFIMSKESHPSNIEWSEENIKLHKKVLGNWTEVYSGQWPDYSEALYDRRVRHNLSNRLSELHYIRRNSGFIYMAEDNYKKFFSSYMMQFVLKPTAQVRSMLFALIAINESLDMLFVRQYHQSVTDLKVMEEKINNLKYLRGMIQTEMSLIYNELDYNRRQHYTSVLEHLITQFRLTEILNRINNKFEIFYDSMQILYQKKSEESQSSVQRGMNLLNWLFGFGILADLGQVLAIAVEAGPSQLFNYSVFFAINAFLLALLIYFVAIKFRPMKLAVGKTVDAVIFDGKGNVVLVRRRHPPFKGQLALPGGFIEEGETSNDAVIREIKEETNLDVKIEKMIGIYDKLGRDPRGRVHSTAFLCSIIGEMNLHGGSDAEQVELVPINQLENKDLAFDHEVILRDALNLIQKNTKR
ncbi:MAG: NUDIX hydrolase [Promethearchaeota archaeon]|nr:MAG: NUDIX hydrolase [Candidatus Lokiarchaeota archaeon]